MDVLAQILRTVVIVVGGLNLVLTIPTGLRQRRSIYKETLAFGFMALFDLGCVLGFLTRYSDPFNYRILIFDVAILLQFLWLINYVKLPKTYIRRTTNEPVPSRKTPHAEA